MSEKVLGFYEKDAIKDSITKQKPFGLWHFNPDKQVPVVSVKELSDLLFNFARNVLCEPRSSTILCNDIKEFLKMQSQVVAKK